MKVSILFFLFFSISLSGVYAKPKPKEAAPDFSRGMIAFSEGQYKEALNYFEQAYETDSKSDDSLYMVALCHLKLENTSKASENFKTLLDRNPDYSKAHFDYGVSLYIQEKYKEAIPVFEKALEAEPKNLQSRLYQALAYNFSGDKEEALAALGRLKAEYPDTAIAKNAADWMDKIETGEAMRLRPKKKESRWSLVGAASFYYDSNVTLDPDAEDLAQFQSNQEEIMGAAALDVRYRLFDRNRWKLYAGYNGYQTAYADKVLSSVDMDRFNYGRHIGGIDYHYQFSDKVQYRMPIYYYYSTLGASRYVQSGVGDGIVDVAWSEKWATTFTGEIRRDDFYANPSNVSQNRDALKPSFSAEHYFFFPGSETRYMKVGYKFEKNFAEGADWDYWAQHALFSFQSPMFWELNFMALADIIPLRKFDHVDSVFNVRRGDFTYTLTGILSHDIMPHLTASLNYTFYRSQSNISLYTYKRQLAGFTLSTSF